MFAKIINRSTRRSGTRRRALLARNSLLAAMSVLTLSMTAAEPLVDARPNSRNERNSRERSEQRGGRTMTRNFSSTAAVTINGLAPASPYPAPIQVSGLRRGEISDVNVVLRGLTHAHSDDIDVILVAPDGTSSMLMSDVGSSTSPAGVTLTLDDQAPNSLPDSDLLVSGTFRPANYDLADAFPSVSSPATQARLARFNGQDPNGEWRLYVVDDEVVDGGVFSGGWTLQLTVDLEERNRRGRGNRR